MFHDNGATPVGHQPTLERKGRGISLMASGTPQQ